MKRVRWRQLVPIFYPSSCAPRPFHSLRVVDPMTNASGAFRIDCRDFSFRARGRPKRDVIRNLGEDEEESEEEDEEGGRLALKFNLAQVVPSDDEYNSDPESLVARLEKCGGPVLPILHKWIDEGRENSDEIVSAIKRLKWLGRFQHALELSDFVMHERRDQLQKVHFLNHLELLGRVKQMKAAEAFLKQMPRQYSRTEAAQLVMFENYIIHESMHNAKLVLRVMKEQGYITTPATFNKLFAVCAKKNREEKIPSLINDMRQLCIAPDEETYQILIGMKAKKGDTEGMERLFRKMKDDGDGAPNAGIYCTLASGYVNAGKFEKAADCLQKVVSDASFKQSRKLHDRTISLFAAMGKVSEVDTIWRFSKRFPVISANSYIATIAAYEKVGQVEKAEEVFKELERKRQVLMTKHYNALFQAYAERNQMRKAEKLLERMMRNKCRLDNNTYHILITGYQKSGNAQMAVETMKKMLNEHLRPSFETMLMVLKIHAENGDVEGAEELFQNMRRDCYTRNVDVYNALLKSYVRADKHAYRFLQRMAMDKVQPNGNTFAMLDRMKPIPKLSQDSQDDDKQAEVLPRKPSAY